jgi:hypothetical protein
MMTIVSLSRNKLRAKYNLTNYRLMAHFVEAGITIVG